MVLVGTGTGTRSSPFSDTALFTIAVLRPVASSAEQLKNILYAGTGFDFEVVKRLSQVEGSAYTYLYKHSHNTVMPYGTAVLVRAKFPHTKSI